jgi:hypothetical protein
VAPKMMQFPARKKHQEMSQCEEVITDQGKGNVKKAEAVEVMGLRRIRITDLKSKQETIRSSFLAKLLSQFFTLLV